MPRIATASPRNASVQEELPGADGDDTAPAPRPPRKARKSGGPPMVLESDLRPLDDTEEFVNLLAYGREGSGKTTSMAMMANLGRVLLVNAEAGIKRAALQRQGVNTSNIVLWPPPGQSVTFEGLSKVYERLRSDLARDANSWVGVGWDSATEITTSILGDVSDDRIKESVAKGDDVNPWVTDRRDYGVLSRQMRLLLRRYRDLPCHFFLTALERRDVDEDTGKVMYGPALPPALAVDLLGYVDIALAFKAGDEDLPFRAASSRVAKYRVKDRFGALPRTLNQPDFLRILDYLDGSLDEESDPYQTRATPPQEEELDDNEEEGDGDDG